MSADPLINKKLGDYTILSLLGRGGMSRVYQGYDENLDRYAAVKVISSDFATTSEEEYTRRFQIEARAIARLRHPNIVGVYQFGRSEGIYYMAMAFLEGQDLRLFLNEYAERRRFVPPAEILRIARDVASALDYAHEQGVIHRDVKPSNIMLEKHTGRAILMDFGLALSVQEGTTGDTFGSAHYIAPEQAMSSAQAVPQSDLYSLGVVLYEMLAGKVPFDDPSAMSVALKHLNDAPPPMTLYNPTLPPQVEAVIMRALDKKPENRYATGRELVDALELAFQHATSIAPAPASAVPPFMPVTDTRPTPWFGQRPNLSTASGDTHPTPEPGRLAQRFARHQAQKEAAQARALTEDQLAIDESELESLLDSYADPRDIGLVGPEAAPLRPSRPASQDYLRDSLAQRTGRQRRARPGLLLFSALFLTVVLIAAWYTVGPGGRDGTADHDGGAPAISGLLPTAEVTEAAAGVTDAATDPSSLGPLASTDEPDATATRTATIPATATAASTTAAPTASATGAPTEAPAATATPERVTRTPRPTVASPTAPPPPTERPLSSATPQPAAPLSPSATVVTNPTLRLLYDAEQFLLVNVSGETQNIGGLVFVQQRPDGTTRTFEPTLWEEGSASPFAMPNGGCYQIITAETPQTDPDDSVCPRFLGWYQPGLTARYFWIAMQPGATFSVGVRGEDETLATCEIAAGECLVVLPRE